MIRTLAVTHHDHLSRHSFEATVAAFEREVGAAEGGFIGDVSAAHDAQDFETQVQAREGRSGFMRFLTIDHGKWLKRIDIDAKAILYVLGNPLIARTMLVHDLAPGLYVPVRLAIHEDAEGRVHVTYDLPSTLMSGLDDESVTAAARKLDAKLIALGETVAGTPA